MTNKLKTSCYNCKYSKMVLSVLLLIFSANISKANQHANPAALQRLIKIDTTGQDSVFTKVEIESSFPGGPGAWSRFLNTKLPQYYTGDVVRRGIQGRAVVQFIVDKEGNTSDVHGVEGHKELQDITEKIISKSGKWTPAVNNGRNVKSYKKQAITYVLQSQ